MVAWKAWGSCIFVRSEFCFRSSAPLLYYVLRYVVTVLRAVRYWDEWGRSCYSQSSVIRSASDLKKDCKERQRERKQEEGDGGVYIIIETTAVGYVFHVTRRAYIVLIMIIIIIIMCIWIGTMRICVCARATEQPLKGIIISVIDRVTYGHKIAYCYSDGRPLHQAPAA